MAWSGVHRYCPYIENIDDCSVLQDNTDRCTEGLIQLGKVQNKKRKTNDGISIIEVLTPPPRQ